MSTDRPMLPAARIAAPLLAVSLLGAPLLAGCNPTVKVEAPDKPIVINLNVKIEQEVRIKVDKDVDNLVSSNPNLF
ncbi:YnbE family lipoprotein [Dongia sp.]|uniref:YnbE family lipoprotein n=1 Tax=Dongia sp. TaxID=1977262 RepID=UPI0035B3A235